MFISNNHPSLHLRWKENFVKHGEVSRYYENDHRFNTAFSKNNLPRIKDGSYVINLNDTKIKQHTGFHYLFAEIQLHVLVPLELNKIELQNVLNKIKDKFVTHTVFRIQADDSIVSIDFIEYILAGKVLFDYTNLFLPNDYQFIFTKWL